jgi:tetratricopeptide (TPR) repeat protein
MNNKSWVDQIEKIPERVKGIIGFITALIAFALLISNNFYVGVTIFVGVSIIALFFYSAYIAFKRDPSRIMGRAGAFRYAKYRTLAFGGIILSLVLAIRLLSWQPSRAFASIAFLGTPVPVPASILIDRLVEFSDATGVRVSYEDDLIQMQEEQCRQDRFNANCWVILAQSYSSANQYRKALDTYTIARNLDTTLADPYYGLGNAYYDLAMIDLIRKRRFELDAEKLTFTVQPDQESAAIFGEVLQKYEQASELTPFVDLNPSGEFRLTSLTILTHRREQMNEFLEGTPTIRFHRMELLRAFIWLLAIFPEDEELQAQGNLLGRNLVEYMLQHPEEFPDIPLSGLTK